MGTLPRRFSGALLRTARRRAGLSRTHLAAQVGRTVWSLAQYELDRVTPPVDVAVGLADVLGVSVDELMASR